MGVSELILKLILKGLKYRLNPLDSIPSAPPHERNSNFDLFDKIFIARSFALLFAFGLRGITSFNVPTSVLGSLLSELTPTLSEFQIVNYETLIIIEK